MQMNVQKPAQPDCICGLKGRARAEITRPLIQACKLGSQFLQIYRQINQFSELTFKNE